MYLRKKKGKTESRASSGLRGFAISYARARLDRKNTGEILFSDTARGSNGRGGAVRHGKKDKG